VGYAGRFEATAIKVDRLFVFRTNLLLIFVIISISSYTSIVINHSPAFNSGDNWHLVRPALS
jgi:hypothetical protein